MMKRLHSFNLIAIAWVCTILLSGCDSKEPEAELLGTITGGVVDKTTGDGVANANIKLSPGGKSVITGSDGLFSFPEIEPGTYTIIVSKENYETVEETVNHSAGRTHVDVVIERRGSKLNVSPKDLDFGTNVNSLSFTITNNGYSDLKYEIDYGTCPWISRITPQSGTISFEKTVTIVVEIDRKKLTSGDNEQIVIIKSTNGLGNAEIKLKAVGEYRASALVNTLDAFNITENNATLAASIENKGTPAYTERGFVWAQDPDPLVEDGCSYLNVPVTDDDYFELQLSSLSANTIYYAKAYVKQNSKYIYGNSITFTTSSRSTKLITLAATQVTHDSAVLNGRITDEGSPVYTERGFCYTVDSYATPDISSNHVPVSGTGTGDYFYKISGFNNSLNVRAYAIQNGKPIYGNEISVKANTVKAEVTTYEATDVTNTSMSLVGYVNQEGKPAYSRRGFCYTSDYDMPNINTATIVEQVVSSAGQFKMDINNLESGTTYYYRAFVEQSGNIIYGKVRQTTTHEAPEIGTKIKDLKADSWGVAWQATFVGWIAHEGLPAYTERGFVFGNYSEPTVGNADKVVCPGYDTEIYEKEVTNLTANKVYYVRAYAKNADGYYYGNTVKFSTTR